METGPRDGRPCPYRRKSETKYCGYHRNYSTLDRPLFGQSSDANWARLLAAGASLVVLIEKAAVYLPRAVDLLSGFSFLSIPLERRSYRPVDSDYFAETLESNIRESNWQAVADQLSESFPDVIERTGPPSALRHQCPLTRVGETSDVDLICS